MSTLAKKSTEKKVFFLVRHVQLELKIEKMEI